MTIDYPCGDEIEIGGAGTAIGSRFCRAGRRNVSGGLWWVLIALAALWAFPSLAWGPEGHAIVADIAEARLSPAARAEVAQLLAIEGDTTLDQVASWPDEIRHQRPETGAWHYVDIPLDTARYDAARDCPSGNCIVAKLAEFERTLTDTSASSAARLEALKWVVHLVGDIHQPLHAEDNRDQGGNQVRVTFAGRQTNLHAVWDGGIIENHYGWVLGPHFAFDRAAVRAVAARMNAEIRPVDAPELAAEADAPGAAILWAEESHRLAQGIYAEIPDAGALPEDYADREWPQGKGRLQAAGVRLAAVLNLALGK